VIVSLLPVRHEFQTFTLPAVSFISHKQLPHYVPPPGKLHEVQSTEAVAGGHAALGGLRGGDTLGKRLLVQAAVRGVLLATVGGTVRDKCRSSSWMTG
jgi:hypothetical protein